MDQKEDYLQLERVEADALLEKGVKFTAGKREFIIKESYLRTSLRLSREFLEIDFNEDRLREDWFHEGRKLINRESVRCARIISIAYLNSKWKSNLFGWYFTWFFLNNVTPTQLKQITAIIFKMANIPDFIVSIRYQNVDMRLTAPSPMEKRVTETEEEVQE